MTTTNKNTKGIFGAIKRNDRAFWTRIGTAFENKDGSWNLRFDYLPTAPATTIQLRELKQEQEDQPAE